MSTLRLIVQIRTPGSTWIAATDLIGPIPAHNPAETVTIIRRLPNLLAAKDAIVAKFDRIDQLVTIQEEADAVGRLDDVLDLNEEREERYAELAGYLRGFILG